MRLQYASRFTCRALIALCGVLLSPAAPESASAAVQPPPCTSSTGAIVSASLSGGAELSAGTNVIAQNGLGKTLSIIVPGTYSSVQAPAGDQVTSKPSMSGNTAIQWTLGTHALPVDYLNLICKGAVRSIFAMNLRGLPLTVQGNDVMSLLLPNGLGSAQLTFAPASQAITFDSAPGSTIELKGSIQTPSLSNRLSVFGSWNGTETALGTASFTAAGLVSDVSAPGVIALPAGPVALSVSSITLSLTPATQTVTAMVVPTLPPALPFTLTPVPLMLTAEGGGMSLACTAPVIVSATKASIGTAPDFTLALTGGVSIACAGGHLGPVSGTLSIGWPASVGAGSVTNVPFQLSSTGLKLTVPPVDLSAAPATFNALGMDATASGSLGVADDDAGSSISLTTTVTLALHGFPELGSAQTNLIATLKPPTAGGDVPVSFGCSTSPAPPVAKAGANQPVVINAVCSGGAFTGISSTGGTLSLAAIKGFGSLSIPPFQYVSGNFQMNGPAACLPPAGSGQGATFMDFGSLSIQQCSFSYDRATGPLIKVTNATIALPDFLLISDGQLKVTDAEISRLPSTKQIGLTKLEAQLTPVQSSLHILTMTATPHNDPTAKAVCNNAKYVASISLSDERTLANPLQLTLCAELSTPAFLSVQSTERLGLLADGVIPPQTSNPTFLIFNGLTIGRGGIVAADPPEKVAGTVCSDQGDFTTSSDYGVDSRVTIFDQNASFVVGPLAVEKVYAGLITSGRDASGNAEVPAPDAPEFLFTAVVTLQKYITTDNNVAGCVQAVFDHQHMLLLGQLKKPATAHIGPVTVGLQSFEMELDPAQRNFTAGGVTISAGTGSAINTNELYFKEIALLETYDGKSWHLKKVSAPVDVPKTALGLAYRLLTDLTAASFLHMFSLK